MRAGGAFYPNGCRTADRGLFLISLKTSQTPSLGLPKLQFMQKTATGTQRIRTEREEPGRDHGHAAAEHTTHDTRTHGTDQREPALKHEVTGPKAVLNQIAKNNFAIKPRAMHSNQTNKPDASSN